MEQVTLIFDRVFDLHRYAQTRYLDRCTLFSFESEGKNRYSVCVPGHPPIAAGMTITALLRDIGNWQTLVGWVDHSTGTVWADPFLLPFAKATFGLIVAIVMVAIARVESPGGFHVGWSIGALAFGVGFLVQLSQGVRRVREYRALEAIAAKLQSV
jgi:hypothetical protein